MKAYSRREQKLYHVPMLLKSQQDLIYSRNAFMWCVCVCVCQYSSDWFHSGPHFFFAVSSLVFFKAFGRKRTQTRASSTVRLFVSSCSSVRHESHLRFPTELRSRFYPRSFKRTPAMIRPLTLTAFHRRRPRDRSHFSRDEPPSQTFGSQGRQTNVAFPHSRVKMHCE